MTSPGWSDNFFFKPLDIRLKTGAIGSPEYGMQAHLMIRCVVLGLTDFEDALIICEIGCGLSDFHGEDLPPYYWLYSAIDFGADSPRESDSPVWSDSPGGPWDCLIFFTVQPKL
jgi:hypothetical protein